MCFFNYGSSFTKLESATYIKFDEAVGKSDDCGYSTTTGLFTVQIPGLYHFTTQVLTHDHGNTGVEIRVDEQPVCETFAVSTKTFSDSISCSTVQMLKVGQKVGVYLKYGQLHAAYLTDQDNQFHGFLIK